MTLSPFNSLPVLKLAPKSFLIPRSRSPCSRVEKSLLSFPPLPDPIFSFLFHVNLSPPHASFLQASDPSSAYHVEDIVKIVCSGVPPEGFLCMLCSCTRILCGIPRPFFFSPGGHHPAPRPPGATLPSSISENTLGPLFFSWPCDFCQ